MQSFATYVEVEAIYAEVLICCEDLSDNPFALWCVAESLFLGVLQRYLEFSFLARV